MVRSALLLFSLAFSVLIGGCSKPAPPAEEKKEPVAAATAAAAASAAAPAPEPAKGEALKIAYSDWPGLGRLGHRHPEGLVQGSGRRTSSSVVRVRAVDGGLLGRQGRRRHA